MGERDTPKDGWLAEQIADAKANIASWPEGYADGLSMAGADLSELAALRAEVVRLREALMEIAGQKKTTELERNFYLRVACFEDGYDSCIARARAALEDSNGTA